MNRHVNAISGRLSLRPPQRRSLEILHRVTEIAPPAKNADAAAPLATIRSEFPSVTDFEREFPSLCFALATGVGKTRLMGAFIAYLHLEHGIRHFFVLAPNLTIYNKLITDFTPNTPKYVFTGISEFAIQPPTVITGETYESGAGVRESARRNRAIPGFSEPDDVHINIFNISKINSEVRGGKSPRIKRLSEYIGESYFEYLAGLPDLVLLMDESHRYRASAGARAINELKPILGLELTATPYVETGRGATPFKNVIFDYPLSRAMADGFVKEPAVVTRKDFNPAGMSTGEIERLKLEDGLRLHEKVKVELEIYAHERGVPAIKPFLLVIARDTTHAAQLLETIQSDAFSEGRYQGKAIQVDSSRSGKDEEEMIERLLKVERPDEPTEIVIHVNMLKEGWDVTNLYTIVPLRAANARVLIEQSIGRGLRLPYGARTGVTAVDRLNIVAHDRFQEIIDEASRPGSLLRLETVELDEAELGRKTAAWISRPVLSEQLGLVPERPAAAALPGEGNDPPVFATPDERNVARLVMEEIREWSRRPDRVPVSARLREPEIQAAIVRAVEERRPPREQAELEGFTASPDIAAVVAKTVEVVTERTIDIPRILVVPTGEVRMGFHPFSLDVTGLNYRAVSEELWVQHLRTHRTEVLNLEGDDGGVERVEDIVVAALAEFDDVSYDDHADLLYDLAGQAARQLLVSLSEEEARKVVRCHQRDIARIIHGQMRAYAWEEAAGYEVRVSRGFTELKECAYSHPAAEAPLDYHVSPEDRTNMARYLFGGFSRCLYTVQKFDSEPERKLAVILERDALKWFRPARGQFGISYRQGADILEYQPDFVAETDAAIWMLEAKAADRMEDPAVLAKKDAAETWCGHATDHARRHGGKPWRYALIPHDAIAVNLTLAALTARFDASGRRAATSS